MDELQDKFRREVEREVEARGLASTLAKWMDAHHKQAAELLGHQQMDWAKAAAALAAHGLKDHTGAPPSAETARQTWLRVEARRAAGMKLKAKK